MSLPEDLKVELKSRIKNDMEPFGKWNDKLWAKITFGDYYGKTPEKLPVIHRVVGETVDNTLKKDNWQMTTESWEGLKNAVDGTDTAETALPDMEEAAAVVEHRKAGGEFVLKFIGSSENTITASKRSLKTAKNDRTKKSKPRKA